jgi:hypothetical protein
MIRIAKVCAFWGVGQLEIPPAFEAGTLLNYGSTNLLSASRERSGFEHYNWNSTPRLAPHLLANQLARGDQWTKVWLMILVNWCRNRDNDEFNFRQATWI